MHEGEQLLFSEDEDAENYGDQIRSIELSPKKCFPQKLDDELLSRIMISKSKPAHDVLLALEPRENIFDPYAEFQGIDSAVPENKIKSPQKGFLFFQSNHSSASKAPSLTMSTPVSAARRRRLIQKLTPVLRNVAEEDDEEEYIPKGGKERNYQKTSPDDDSPVRRVLRPRKPEWIDEDHMPLSALRDALIFQKNEREKTSAKKSSVKKKKKRSGSTEHSCSVSVSTPVRTRRKSGPRKLFSSPKPLEFNNVSKRKADLAYDSSDDELLINIAKRMKSDDDAIPRDISLKE